MYIWVLVKTMVPFWILIIIRHLILRVPKKGPQFCQPTIHNFGADFRGFGEGLRSWIREFKVQGLGFGLERFVGLRVSRDIFKKP